MNARIYLIKNLSVNDIELWAHPNESTRSALRLQNFVNWLHELYAIEKSIQIFPSLMQVGLSAFADQADHSLTIEWRHTNHTKFRI